MPGSDPVTHFVDVPGARLYYERRGTAELRRTAMATAARVVTYNVRRPP